MNNKIEKANNKVSISNFELQIKDQQTTNQPAEVVYFSTRLSPLPVYAPAFYQLRIAE